MHLVQHPPNPKHAPITTAPRQTTLAAADDRRQRDLVLLRLWQEARDTVDDEHLGGGVVCGRGERGAVRRRGVAGEERVEGGVLLYEEL